MTVAERSIVVDRLIGNTPLVPLRRVVVQGGAEVRAKLEGSNPGGSIKDRTARGIVRAAEATGELQPGKTLLDASSGNTGIAYAMLAASRGYGCEICMPANASRERRKLLEAYGARVVITDAEDGTDGAIREARRRVEADPERYFYADQYNNQANWRAHYETTGPEIWAQTGGRITHLVAGLGTSGTMMGTGRSLRKRRTSLTLLAVQPASPFHGIEGVKHMETAIVPGIYDPELPDEVLTVRTEEAQEMARRLAREEGLLVGVSGGGNVVAAVRVAAELAPEDLVVTFLPDGGERYLSEPWLGNGKR